MGSLDTVEGWEYFQSDLVSCTGMVVRRWGCGEENHELLLECGSVSAHTCSVDFFSLSLSLSYFLLINFLFVFSFLVASSKKNIALHLYCTLERVKKHI